MKFTVLNLPRNFDEQEVAALFKAYGNISACHLVLNKENGTSKGFAFVEMALEHEGKIALKELHGSKIGKNTIRVKQTD